MNFKQFVLESKSGYLYHFSANPLEQFLSSGRLYFNEKQEEHNETIGASNREKYEYFLSTSRVPRGGYNFDMDEYQDNIIFQLDARKLSYRYRIAPVHYPTSDEETFEDIVKDPSADEFEERVYSHEDSIPLKGYVVAIHYYYAEDSREDEDSMADFREYMQKDILPRIRRLGLTLYLYDDIQAFGLLDTRRARKYPLLRRRA
jgi:hypothetical protein